MIYLFPCALHGFLWDTVDLVLYDHIACRATSHSHQQHSETGAAEVQGQVVTMLWWGNKETSIQYSWTSQGELQFCLKVTCSVWRGPDEGGKHLDTRLFMWLLWQSTHHLITYPLFHFQQLLTVQTEGVEDALTLLVLSSKTVGHCRYHGRTFPTTNLRSQKTHIAVRHKSMYHLVEPPGKPDQRWQVWLEICVVRFVTSKFNQLLINPHPLIHRSPHPPSDLR